MKRKTLIRFSAFPYQSGSFANLPLLRPNAERESDSSPNCRASALATATPGRALEDRSRVGSWLTDTDAVNRHECKIVSFPAARIAPPWTVAGVAADFDAHG
jgi:hypothetical protein